MQKALTSASLVYGPRMTHKQIFALASAQPMQVRCIEFERLPHTCMASDIFRLIHGPSRSPDKAANVNVLRVLRKFTSDFRSADVFLALFATPEGARTALRTVMGHSMCARPHMATLVPLSTLSGYAPLNELVDETEACLTITGFPASTTTKDLRGYFADFQLKGRLLESSINWGTTKKVALVEFASRDEAHRAYRKLMGKPTVCMASGRPYTPFLDLLL